MTEFLAVCRVSTRQVSKFYNKIPPFTYGATPTASAGNPLPPSVVCLSSRICPNTSNTNRMCGPNVSIYLFLLFSSSFPFPFAPTKILGDNKCIYQGLNHMFLEHDDISWVIITTNSQDQRSFLDSGSRLEQKIEISE